MFSKATDEWRTPQAFFMDLHEEFGIGLDVAARAENRQTLFYLGPDHEDESLRDALMVDWKRHTGSLPWHSGGLACWLNPPYSRCREFIAKAAAEARRGCTTVALVPSRTDTRWWHEHVWDDKKHQPRKWVETRFVRGRLKFGGGKNSAPFPSVVIIFRG